MLLQRLAAAITRAFLTLECPDDPGQAAEALAAYLLQELPELQALGQGNPIPAQTLDEAIQELEESGP